MDVKEAIAAAKNYARDIYAKEGVTNFGLEEVEHVLQVGIGWLLGLFPVVEYPTNTRAGGFGKPWCRFPIEEVV